MARPPKYRTVEELDYIIQEYFDLDHEKDPVTITGLILHCGFCSRQSFYDMEKKDEFMYTIKKARLRVASYYEKLLHGNSVAGPIFALKNLGWSDRQEIDHTSGGDKINLNITVDKSETAETLKKLRDGTQAH